MQTFYSPLAKESSVITLDHEESRHVSQVLRKKPGDKVLVTDGQGSCFEAEISSCNSKQVVLIVSNLFLKENPVSHQLHVAICPTKNIDRFEYFMEKATEMGVNVITPLLTKRTERSKLNYERLRKILMSAMKQSGRFFLPELREMQSIQQFIDDPFINSDKRFIAYCEGERKSLNELYLKGESLTILIGPEGDFTPEEVEMAMKKNFKPVSLGPFRLRVETAGIAATYSVNLLNQ